MFDNIGEPRLKTADYYRATLENERATREQADKQIIGLLYDVKNRYDTKLESYMAKKKLNPNTSGQSNNSSKGKKAKNNKKADNSGSGDTGGGSKELSTGWDEPNEGNKNKSDNNTGLGVETESWGTKVCDDDADGRNQSDRDDENDQDTSDDDGDNEGEDNGNDNSNQVDSNTGWGSNTWGEPKDDEKREGNEWGSSTDDKKKQDVHNTSSDSKNSHKSNKVDKTNSKVNTSKSNNENKAGNNSKTNNSNDTSNKNNSGCNCGSNNNSDKNNSGNQNNQGKAKKNKKDAASSSPSKSNKESNSLDKSTKEKQDGSAKDHDDENKDLENKSYLEMKSQLWTAKLDLRLLERDKNKLEEDLTTIRGDRDQLVKKLGLANQENDNLKVKVRGLTVDLVSANDEIHKLNERLDQMEAERRNRHQDLSINETARKNMENKFKAYQQQIADLQSELRLAKDERDDHARRSQELIGRNQRLERDIVHSKNLIKTLKDGCLVVESQAKDFELRHESVAMSKADLEKELIAIKEESSRHITTINNLQKSNEQISKAFVISVEEHDKLKNEVQTLQEQYEKKVNSLTIDKLRLVEANNQLHRLVEHLRLEREKKTESRKGLF